MRTYILLLYFFRVCLCDHERIDYGGLNNEDLSFELNDKSDGSEVLNGTLQRIVKTYHCSAENIEDEQIILYGTKAWTFPSQNVNLTLRYPATKPENDENDDKYVITSFLMVLYIDGYQSRGYVTQGGILMDRISMTFVIGNISRLSYQFWLYGVSKDYVNISEYSWHQNLC